MQIVPMLSWQLCTLYKVGLFLRRVSSVCCTSKHSKVLRRGKGRNPLGMTCQAQNCVAVTGTEI